MKTLIKGAMVVNVFTDSLERWDVLISDGMIVGTGDYREAEADLVVDAEGKILTPGFIDGHIHIESTMLTPGQFADVCLPHGTTTVIADPHEIANVAGTAGIEFMLQSSQGLPVDIYYVLPSCVPATPLDETGATLTAADLAPIYERPGVIGLGEMMNYPGVLDRDPEVMAKLDYARASGKLVNGHAPLVTGRDLDRYLSAGISDDHECSEPEEAKERIRKGQRVMIRQGTAARNLEGLLSLFDEPYNRRCLLVTDDRHPADLLYDGHIDTIIRQVGLLGKSPLTAIRMATIQAAEHFGLRWLGAVAPGYQADLVLVEDLESMKVSAVYKRGQLAAEHGKALPFTLPQAEEKILSSVYHSFHLDELTCQDFYIPPQAAPARVISVIPDQLLTQELHLSLDFSVSNGISVQDDILKLAVIERHKNTGHRGVGYIKGIGLKKGAIASSVAHDAHNLIVIGTNEADMALAANRIIQLGGGNAVVAGGKVLAEMALPVGGLMTDLSAREAALENRAVREAVRQLGAPETIEPFMTMAFISLPVIPALKMTTRGLADVTRQQIVPLFLE